MRWLLDEMLPPAAAEQLRQRGHDAVSVLDVGMAATEDAEVFAPAVDDDRVIVTENFADYAALLQQRQGSGERCVPVVFVRRDSFPRRGSLAAQLAQRLDTWATANPDLFIGLYWP